MTTLDKIMADVINDLGLTEPRPFWEKYRHDRDALADMLDGIINEADQWDDHDGRLGHVSYATIALAQALLRRVGR